MYVQISRDIDIWYLNLPWVILGVSHAQLLQDHAAPHYEKGLWRIWPVCGQPCGPWWIFFVPLEKINKDATGDIFFQKKIIKTTRALWREKPANRCENMRLVGFLLVSCFSTFGISSAQMETKHFKFMGNAICSPNWVQAYVSSLFYRVLQHGRAPPETAPFKVSPISC